MNYSLIRLLLQVINSIYFDFFQGYKQRSAYIASQGE